MRNTCDVPTCRRADVRRATCDVLTYCVRRACWRRVLLFRARPMPNRQPSAAGPPSGRELKRTPTLRSQSQSDAVTQSGLPAADDVLGRFPAAGAAGGSGCAAPELLGSINPQRIWLEQVLDLTEDARHV